MRRPTLASGFLLVSVGVAALQIGVGMALADPEGAAAAAKTPGVPSDIWTWLTNLTGAYPWIWPALFVAWATSRALRTWFPTGGSQAVAACMDEITRLRKLCNDAGIDAGQPFVAILDTSAGRPAPVAAILSVISPFTTVFDGIFWALRSIVRATVKRITGEEMPDGESGVLRLPK